MSIPSALEVVQRALLGRVYHQAYPLACLWWRVTAPVSLGVRAIVLDHQGRVLLVRHAYGSEGWGFPGGAPARRELLAATAQREVREETGVRCSVERLLGIYDSFQEGKSDHVALFICRAHEPAQAQPVSAEIVATGFYGLDALPRNTSEGTLRRLAELNRADQSYWGLW